MRNLFCKESFTPPAPPTPHQLSPELAVASKESVLESNIFNLNQKMLKRPQEPYSGTPYRTETGVVRQTN